MIRLTRNCPWNRCTFCPVYKGTQFSVRPVAHIINDIDIVKYHIDRIKDRSTNGIIHKENVQALWNETESYHEQPLHAALNWFMNNMRSVFLQDANSLIMKPSDLTKILTHLGKQFPEIQRITSYARSHTIARISQIDLDTIAGAGLNRIHIGLESGSDAVLALSKKGVSKAAHIKAGLKVKQSNMELSEYVMPGLGGKALSEDHALETADAINQINPDFIRFRSLAIPSSIPLKQMVDSGEFVPCSDIDVAREIHFMISHFNNIQSVITSDHVLNLFEDVQGRLPDNQSKMLSIIDQFLNLPAQEQMIFQVGRRLGIMRFLSQLDQPSLRHQVESICRQMNVTPENVDASIQELIKRFI
ncbi:MAG: coproporphyrinogen oxidase (NAD) [Candidatus Magnetoglobus multicellularis str. Araruama]|uniref:Coproporphyrinogen oxidase (NAD) n=1 Tax=Candidatus Magnetoglobus multicellularis str. Araruama TaxID=890399 RepID=A0A1V1P6Q5_9BACT|nr:MAG: coproporphyrinogen oxidase (NAD) [Candidatus Magnetoglobus multicellularis str. Araruama]